MTVGGLALLVPPFLGPPNGADDTRQRLLDLAADPAPTLAKSLIMQLSILLLLPGVAAIIGRAHGRGGRMTVLGGVGFCAGLMGAFTFVVLMGVEASLAQSAPVDTTLVAAADEIIVSPAAVPAIFLAMLLFHLVALPLLACGMVRVGQLRLWAAFAATLGTAFTFFGTGTRIEAAGWLILGVTLAYMGSTLWSTQPTTVRNRDVGWAVQSAPRSTAV
jgi:hypothetical protein